MPLRIGIENGNEGRTMAWALDHPGCISYGGNALTALGALPAAIQEFNSWLISHGLEEHIIQGVQSVDIEETWEVYHINDYEVNAWFQDDWRPLTEAEIKTGSSLLLASRAALLSSVDILSEETRNQQFPRERWNIAGILNHVGKAEHWYLDRLGLAIPEDELPSDPDQRLNQVRAHLLSTLPTLAGSSQVVGVDGEFWSPRKLLRRAVWHERDHTSHIRKLSG